MTKAFPTQAMSRYELLRVRAWPILQTAVAAVAAWYLAKLLLTESKPVFASIAAVVALDANTGFDSVSSSLARYQAATAATAVWRIGHARTRNSS